MKINGDKNCKTELDNSLKNWSKYAKEYDPIKCASIDGIDIEPHDRAVIRALNSEYKPNRFVKGRPECTIFVSRLNHETSKETIKEIFSKYGKLRRFRMVKDIVTGMPKGYAFVEFEEEQAAEEAYRLANKMVVDGNIIFVDFECERLLKGWRPRRLGGGFAGKKESGQLRFGGRDRPFKKPIALELKEKEERKLREKRKRREDQRHHRDKSRERLKKRSPFHNDRRSPLKDKTRHSSPLKDDKAKKSSVVRDKERSRSPPRKVARPNSTSKEIGRHQSPLRENIKQHTPRRENIKQHSPQRNHGKPRSPPRENIRQKSLPREDIKHHTTSRKYGSHHSSIHEDIKRQTSPTDKTRIRSPRQKVGRQHSPLRGGSDRHSRDNVKYDSPPREDLRNHLSRQAMDRHFISRGENMKYSPTRDHNLGRHSPLQKHLKPSARENDRRHSPVTRNDQSHSTRSNDNFLPREDFRYRSPRRDDIKHTSPRNNERHFSPPRENDRQYFSSRENIRSRSPTRENNGRRPISPQIGTHTRISPMRDFIPRYSPTMNYHHSSSRELRHHSPPSQNPRNFQIQNENANYPPPYYSESSGPKNFSPVRETARPFTPPRTVREPPQFRDDFPPPREDTRYFPPQRENERQYDSHYSTPPDSENYDYFPHEQNTITFPPAHDSQQFPQSRNHMDWRANPQNPRRRFPPSRGKYRGAFRRY